MQIHWLYEHSEHWIGFTILYPCSAFHLDTDWTTRQVQPTSCRLLLLPLSKALNRKKQRKMFIAFLKQNFKRDILSCISLRFLKSVNYNSKEGAWGFTLTGWADGAARCYYTGGAVKTKPVSPCRFGFTLTLTLTLTGHGASCISEIHRLRPAPHPSAAHPDPATDLQRPSPSEGNQRCRENQRFLCNCPTAAGFRCSPQWWPAETGSTLWFHVALQSRGGWWCDETLTLSPHFRTLVGNWIISGHAHTTVVAILNQCLWWLPAVSMRHIDQLGSL